MRKILYVLNTGSYSGAENVIIQIINHLDKAKYSGIYTGLEGKIGNVLKKDGIPYEPMTALNPRNLRRVIEKVKPDIIHANDYTAVCVLALCKCKTPVIAHLHNNSTWIKKIGPRTVLFALCVKKCVKVLTVSEAITREFAFPGILKHKTECIGNPVDIQMIRDQYPDKANKEYDIIVLGRLSEAKSPILSLSIIKEISDKQEIKAIFVGDGELREETEKAINEFSLNGIVELAGFRENPYEYIAKSKVMLMPSKWEGFGLAAVEGLAFGVPVIASEAGGLPDIISDACGKICTKKTEYTEEIIRLLEDQEYYRQKSEAAIERANQMDNTNLYFAKLNRIYDGLYDQNGTTE